MARNKTPHATMANRSRPTKGQVTKNVRDVVVTAVGTDNTPLIWSTSAPAYSVCLAASGISGVTVAGNVFSNIVAHPARLPWLSAVSNGYEEYRMTRATLVLSGYSGSTATGDIYVTTTTDMSDTYIATPQFHLSIAALAAKDWRVPLDISTSWKTTGSQTLRLGPSGAFIYAEKAMVDLCPGAFRVSCQSSYSGIYCTAVVEYDVEFRKPLTGTNL